MARRFRHEQHHQRKGEPRKTRYDEGASPRRQCGKAWKPYPATLSEKRDDETAEKQGHGNPNCAGRPKNTVCASSMLRAKVVGDHRKGGGVKTRLPDPNSDAGKEQLPEGLRETARDRHDTPYRHADHDDVTPVQAVCGAAEHEPG